MGIYDRDYYRREGPSFLASFTKRGTVCKWLILINVVVFVLQLVTRSRHSDGFVTDFLILDTAKVLHSGQAWRLLTYAFLHSPDNLLHILFNMLFLWWFGSDIEDMYGPQEFLAFYLTTAVVGGIAFVGINFLGYPEMLSQCLGASGAVMAVLILCALHFPMRIIRIMFVFPVPIWLVVVIAVAYDAYQFLTGSNTGTAVTVHLAGAAFGFVYYKRHWRLLDILPSLKRPRLRRRPPLRVYREEEPEEEAVTVASRPTPRELVDEHLEAQLDAVLEKVARHGQESLTPGEREILQRASEIYRRKRT
jgi:membrane associated rhomboid family serine protease